MIYFPPSKNIVTGFITRGVDWAWACWSFPASWPEFLREWAGFKLVATVMILPVYLDNFLWTGLAVCLLTTLNCCNLTEHYNGGQSILSCAAISTRSWCCWPYQVLNWPDGGKKQLANEDIMTWHTIIHSCLPKHKIDIYDGMISFKAVWVLLSAAWQPCSYTTQGKVYNGCPGCGSFSSQVCAEASFVMETTTLNSREVVGQWYNFGELHT